MTGNILSHGKIYGARKGRFTQNASAREWRLVVRILHPRHRWLHSPYAFEHESPSRRLRDSRITIVLDSTARNRLAGRPGVKIAKRPDKQAQADRSLRPMPTFKPTKRQLDAPKEPLDPGSNNREIT